MRFSAPAKVTAMLGLNNAANTYPALEVIQDGVQATFETYLSRELILQARTKKVYFKGTMIPLRGLPVRSVASVTLTAHAGVIQGLGYVLDLPLTPTDYMITPYGIKLVSYIANGNAYATVTYTGGIAADAGGIAIPTDAEDAAFVAALEQASLRQIMHEWARKDNSGAIQVSSNGGTTRYVDDDILIPVQRLLSNHRHPMGGFA